MNMYVKSCLMHVDPRATEDDLEEIIDLNEDEIFFKFKDGRKIVYNSLTGYSRNVNKKSNELSDEEWVRIFGRNIRDIMIRKRINQEELSRKLGVSQGMVSNYIRGYSRPDIVTVRRIALVLECSINDLFYKEY